ncbi:concanavalin A-like lectin/glucanase domain-containing protein [Gigaspora rosea]|uniref:Concanavalin A-like lectin/glucanase domain-containing protein n=1 Tax=Gigaspora rosea TaxID=44941 RepID=A0A397UFQ6_9GLOM|nr:concanavalin A-like lectin/glucanase domain-containing protein [Gigaspora rosea]
MNELELYKDVLLPTAWDLESSFLSIDGLKVKYIGPDDYKVAAIIRTNNPIPSQCKFFYFEVKIIDNGKNGMIGIGFCTKSSDQDKKNIDIMALPGQENNSWGYHSDDGYLFCSGSGEPYGPPYTIGDTIGCYLNFKNRIVFYTKNGINLGIACDLPDDLKEGSLYPCAGFRSQGEFIEVNFGDRNFEYSVMTNKDINHQLNNTFTKHFIKTKTCCLAVEYKGKNYFIKGEYEETLLDLINKLPIHWKKIQIT